MTDVVGLVPAAGVAKRLGRLPCSKELLPIGFGDDRDDGPKPISEYLLRNLRDAGAQRVYVVLRQHKWDIPAYFGDGNQIGIPMAYLMMRLPYGTAFTLDQAYPFVRDSIVLLGFPDILFRPADALRRLLERQRRTGADVVLGLFPTPTPEKMDMVETDRAGRVLKIEIKPDRSSLRYSWIIAAWSPTFTEFLHGYVGGLDRPLPGSEEEQADIHVGRAFQAAIDRQLRVEAVRFPKGGCLDIGTPGDLRRAVHLGLGPGELIERIQ